MRAALALLAVAGIACAQQANYTAYREASLSAAAEAVTIQQPASPTRTAYITGAWIYCSVACVVTLEHSGSAATTTSFTPTAATPGIGASTIMAFHTSNVGSGTVVSKYDLGAGETKSLAMTAVLPMVANSNMTFRIASITGSVRITWMWNER